MNTIFSNDTDNTDLNRRGFKLERIDVLSGGSGYTNTVNALSLSAEPDYTETAMTSEHIVGNAYNENLKKYGPLIRVILYSGYLEFTSVLGADRTMMTFAIESSEITQTTNVTSFDSVAIVQNLKTNADTKVNIEEKVGKNKVFRMSDIITTTASNTFAVGEEVQSSVVSGGTRGTGAKVAAKPSANKMEVTRHDGNIVTADKVWSPTKTSNTTITTGLKSQVTVVTSASKTKSGQYISGSVSGSSSVTGTVSTVEKGEGKLAQDSLVLYSNKLGAADSITQSQGIRVRFIIGGSEILPV